MAKAKRKKGDKSIKIGTFDSNKHLTPLNVIGFIATLNKFNELNDAAGTPSTLFQSYADTNVIEKSDSSTAYTTFGEKSGLCNRNMMLSPIGYLLLKERIDIHEYEFLLLTKQWIWLNDSKMHLLKAFFMAFHEDGITVSEKTKEKKTDEDTDTEDVSETTSEETPKKKMKENFADYFSASVGPKLSSMLGVDENEVTNRLEFFRTALLISRLCIIEDNVFKINPETLNVWRMICEHDFAEPSDDPTSEDYYIYLGNITNGIFEIDDLEPIKELYPNLYKIKNLKEMKTEQKIFYGAPGTGKSNTIKEETKGQKVVRVTFHPDSDYASFVGVYKPTMNGTKIEYNFIKQAFLKAYLKAWQKMTNSILKSVKTSDTTADTSKPDNTKHYTKDGVTITSADSTSVKYDSSDTRKKDCCSALWMRLCKDEEGTRKTPSGITFKLAICEAIKEIVGKYDESKYDEGMTELLRKIKTQNGFVVKSPNQEYHLFPNPDDEDSFITITYSNGASKEAVRKFYGDGQKTESAQSKIAEILESIDAENFDRAWNKLMHDLNGNENVNTQAPTISDDHNPKDTTIYAPEPQFLVIEEINRGNCAQIFGDLFQLLDRQDSGYSSYPIEADSDIQQAIEKAFKEEDEYKLNGDLTIDGVVEGYVSNYNKSLSKDVQEGRVLLLPPNLCIWATMNTSDQSLFPMDSAFKRRWDWVYVPIAQGMKRDEYGKETSESLGWQIKIDEKYEPIDWWQFLQKINAVISKLTSSEDKQLGYFFCKPDEEDKKTISAKRFVGKVIFYLWNDILKDYAFDDDICNKGSDQKETLYFADFYSKQNELNIESLITFFNNLDKEQPDIEKKNVTLLRKVTKNDGSENKETPEA